MSKPEVETIGCYDCNRSYEDGGFPDLIIPFWAWKKISPSGDDGGLLCPSCICKRLYDAGIRCEGAFLSGPIISVSGPLMTAMRGIENIELAIEGRDNRWSGIREIVKKEAARTIQMKPRFKLVREVFPVCIFECRKCRARIKVNAASTDTLNEHVCKAKPGQAERVNHETKR